MLHKTPEADILGLNATDGPPSDNRFVFQWTQLIDFVKDCLNTVYVYGVIFM